MKTCRSIFACVVIALLATKVVLAEGSPTMAADFTVEMANEGEGWAELELGRRYLDPLGAETDYTLALKYISRAAAKGIPGAIYELGMMNQLGLGLDLNLSEAEALYERAAELGYLPAIEELMKIITQRVATGEITTNEKRSEDLKKLGRLHRNAADLGDPKAQLSFGSLVLDPLGQAMGLKELGLENIEKSAMQDFAAAQSCLAKIYLDGTHVPQSFIEAYKWANIAAANGDAEASHMRKELLQLMTKEQLALAQMQSSALSVQIKERHGTPLKAGSSVMYYRGIEEDLAVRLRDYFLKPDSDGNEREMVIQVHNSESGKCLLAFVTKEAAEDSPTINKVFVGVANEVSDIFFGGKPFVFIHLDENMNVKKAFSAGDGEEIPLPPYPQAF